MSNPKNSPKVGRPALHADAAARQKAWRAANKVKTVRLDGKIAPTVAELAAMFGTTETHCLNNLLRFALANRCAARRAFPTAIVHVK